MDTIEKLSDHGWNLFGGPNNAGEDAKKVKTDLPDQLPTPIKDLLPGDPTIKIRAGADFSSDDI